MAEEAKVEMSGGEGDINGRDAYGLNANTCTDTAGALRCTYYTRYSMLRELNRIELTIEIITSLPRTMLPFQPPLTGRNITEGIAAEVVGKYSRRVAAIRPTVRSCVTALEARRTGRMAGCRA